MGCDIHIKTEIKTVVNDKTVWVSSDYYKKNRYFNILEGETREYETIEIYQNRDYELFTILADVRNGGIGGCICEPKGIPKDICKETKEEMENWSEDGHSNSYFTLKELIEANNPKLYELIASLKKRYKEYFYYFDDRQVQTDKIRIVFWFDN